MRKKEIEIFQKKILDELLVNPIISIACKKAGVSKATFYRWQKIFPKFSNQCSLSRMMGIDNINDLAESSLIKNIREGDFKSTKFWLETNHPAYKSNNSNFTYDFQKLLDENARLVLTLLKVTRGDYKKEAKDENKFIV